MTSSPVAPAQRDRIAGALLGVHAGDALGATLEFAPMSLVGRATRTACATLSAAGRSAGRPGTRPTTPT